MTSAKSLALTLGAIAIALSTGAAAQQAQTPRAQLTPDVQSMRTGSFRLPPASGKEIVQLKSPRVYRVCNSFDSKSPMLVLADAVQRPRLEPGECLDLEAAVIHVENPTEAAPADQEAARVASGVYVWLDRPGGPEQVVR